MKSNPSGMSVTKLLDKMKFGSEGSKENPEDGLRQTGLAFFQSHFNHETIAKMKAAEAERQAKLNYQPGNAPPSNDIPSWETMSFISLLSS